MHAFARTGLSALGQYNDMAHCTCGVRDLPLLQHAPSFSYPQTPMVQTACRIMTEGTGTCWSQAHPQSRCTDLCVSVRPPSYAPVRLRYRACFPTRAHSLCALSCVLQALMQFPSRQQSLVANCICCVRKRVAPRRTRGTPLCFGHLLACPGSAADNEYCLRMFPPSARDSMAQNSE